MHLKRNRSSFEPFLAAQDGDATGGDLVSISWLYGALIESTSMKRTVSVCATRVTGVAIWSSQRFQGCSKFPSEYMRPLHLIVRYN